MGMRFRPFEVRRVAGRRFRFPFNLGLIATNRPIVPQRPGGYFLSSNRPTRLACSANQMLPSGPAAMQNG